MVSKSGKARERGDGSSLPRLSALTLFFLYPIFSVLAIYGCETDGQEENIPGIPLLHRADTIPQQDAIRIEWDANTEEDLAGYKVYRRISPEAKAPEFQTIATVLGDDSYYEDTDVAIGVKYYYRISAFNESGNESEKSSVVDYTLLEKPILTEPVDQATIETTSPVFAWLGVPGASSYTIHVHGRAADAGTWEETWCSEKVYPYQDLSKAYNDDNHASKPLESGMTCRWLVDSSGGPSVGSQSRWRHFSVSIGE